MRIERIPFEIGMALVAVFLGLVGDVDAAWADRAQAKYWFEKGVALEASDELVGALDCYERAMDADDDHREAYRRASRLWALLEAFDRAIPRLERYTLRHPGQASAWYVLAYAYRRTERWQHAALAYESYIDLRSDEAAPYFGLAMARMQLGQEDGARDAFTRYLELERDPGRAMFVDQARRELERLGGAHESPAATGDERMPSISTRPQARVGDSAHDPVTEHRVYRYMGRAEELLAAGRVDAAHALASRISPTDEDQERVRLFLVARIAVARGQVVEARESLLALLAAVPTHMAAYRLLERLR